MAVIEKEEYMKENTEKLKYGIMQILELKNECRIYKFTWLLCRYM